MTGLSDVTIDCYLEGSSLESMAVDVRSGLTRSGLKMLPPKYFYDDRGSELFDEITSLPEYYPTRCERAILNRRAPEIVEITGATELLELGSGMASKTRALLFAMAGAGTLERYLPMDVSELVVERCATELVEMYPGLTVYGVVGDFEQHLVQCDRRTAEDRSSMCLCQSGGSWPFSAARSATCTRTSAPPSSRTSAS